MTATGRALGAGLALAALLSGPALAQGQALAQSPAPQQGPTPSGPTADRAAEAKLYVGGFCLPIAGGYVDDDHYSPFLGEWHARPGSSREGIALQPLESDVPGQVIHFTGEGAPAAAFVEPRRGACSLLWKAPAVAPDALAELATQKPPVGAKGAPVAWRRVIPAPHVGPPRAPRWLLLQNGSETSGVCVEERDDLRLRDGSPVSMLQVFACRLGEGEKLRAG